MAVPFESLTRHLNALNDSLKQTTQLIQRLSKLQPTDAGDNPTTGFPNGLADEAFEASSIDELRQDIAADIQDALTQHGDDLALLQQDVADAATPAGIGGAGSSTSHKRHAGLNNRSHDKERDLARLAATCATMEEDLRLARTRYRSAQLSALRNIERAAQHTRAQYLAYLRNLPTTSTPTATATTSGPLLVQRHRPARDPNATDADLTLTAATDVTSSLRRTHAALAAEVSRSRFAHETLASSNAALVELDARYSSLDELLGRARGLLGTLLRSQKSDTWYLETACWCLGVTIAWLLFRRLMYGPVMWLVVWPLRLWWRVVMWVLGGAWSVVAVRKPVTTDMLGSVSNTGAGTTVLVMPTISGVQSATLGGMPAASTHASPGLDAAVDAAASSMSDAISQMLDRSSQFVLTAGDMAVEATPAPQKDTDADAGGDANATPAGEEIDTTSSEQAQQQAQQHAQVAEPQAQQARRADGQLLRARDEAREPRNPKKRMFEEPPRPSPTAAAIVKHVEL